MKFFKTGKKLVTKASKPVELKFARYFGADLPPIPLQFGPWDDAGRPLISEWSMLANAQAGDCVICSACHGEMLTSAKAGKPVPKFTNRTAIADYSAALVASGQPGYDPNNAATDTGLDLQRAAAWRQQTGVGDILGARYKIGVYTALKVGDPDELAAAMYLFGAVDIGVNLPSSAEDQFNAAEPWTVVPNDKSEGGHCVCGVGRNSKGNILVVTWGRLQAATADWIAATMDEGIVYVPLDRATPALLDDFKQVTA